jgi:hypothetical protein
MHPFRFFKGIATTLLTGYLLTAPSGLRAKEPTNPAAASVCTPIRLTPQEMFRDSGGEMIRTTVLEGDLDKANVLYTFRTELPDHFMIPPHFHPADEHITIIAGTFNMGHGRSF